MHAHWDRYPPVHVTAALFAGIKPQREHAARAQEETSARDALIERMPVKIMKRPS